MGILHRKKKEIEPQKPQLPSCKGYVELANSEYPFVFSDAGTPRCPYCNEKIGFA